MRRRRLVLVLSTVFKVRGGIPRFNQLLCRAIDDLAPQFGVVADVFSLHDGPEDFERAAPGWKNLRFIPTPGQLRIVLEAGSWCARHRPDGLIVGLVGMSPVGLACQPFLRHGFVVVAHGGTDAWEEKRGLRRLAMRRARYAWSVSGFTGDMLVSATGLAAERVRLLPNALEPGMVPADLSARPRGLPEILVVSRLWAEEKLKGVDHTIGAFGRLAADFPEWRLRIVGKGSDKPRLEALAEATGFGDRIAFEEDLDDSELAARYGQCAVFALPSGQEGFGIVFLEAMIFSKPCIGGSHGGIPEVVLDGRTGLLVPHGDVARLESALRRLAGDAGLREALGRAGRERVLEHYTYPVFRSRVETHLGEWLGS